MQQPTILVIDDDEAVRKAFTLAFEDSEYRVDTAESGGEGIGMVKGSRYDLVLLDLKMPGLNGIQTLRAIRKLNADLPVYLVTAFHKEFFEEIKCVVQDRISFDVVQKPIDGEQIRAIAAGVLEGAVAV